ncbi:hypothetical protein J1614_010732, partial [Plenodomus biglobosus]
MASSKQLTCADYHIAWICPVADIKLLPAPLMLDEQHSTPPYDTHYDKNTYIWPSTAMRETGRMFNTFPNIRMAVLVGTRGGIPSPAVSEDALENVHRGDVVVGWPGDGKPACVYHGRGRSNEPEQWLVVVDNADDEMHEVEVPEWIGCCEQTLGRYRAAEQAYGQVLGRREKVLGKEHPSTLTSMNKLALARSCQGKYAEADAMRRATLALRERVVRKDHPHTLMSMNNLNTALKYLLHVCPYYKHNLVE